MSSGQSPVSSQSLYDRRERTSHGHGRRLRPSGQLVGARLETINAAASIAFTTHEMSPASVLALAEELYGKAPAGFLLKIRGLEWDFAEGLSAAAVANLEFAKRLLREFFRSR